MNLGQQGMFGCRIAHSCLKPVMVSCNADSHEANNTAQSPLVKFSVRREGYYLTCVVTCQCTPSFDKLYIL